MYVESENFTKAFALLRVYLVPITLLFYFTILPASEPDAFELEEVTIADLQEGMRTGTYSARSIVEIYLRRVKEIDRDGLNYGVGWHLDVAPHPDFANNGWIYLHHTDLCGDCRKKKYLLFFSKSMNRLVRGYHSGETEDLAFVVDDATATYEAALARGARSVRDALPNALQVAALGDLLAEFDRRSGCPVSPSTPTYCGSRTAWG